jgi:DNA repair exonuclease SbcCD ATPase subunit
MSPSEYEQLVLFLGERFETIDRRFDTIDQRFDSIDRRFEIVGQRFESMDRRFETIDRRFDELRAELLGHFDEIYRRLERLEQEYHAITQALRRIEALLVDERVRREILERDLATLRGNVAALNARIEDIERRLRSGS